jgi:hypothetical protein
MSTALSIGRPQDPAAVRSVSFDDVVATYAVDGLLTTRPEIFFPETPRQDWQDLCTPTGDLLVSVGGLLVQTAGTTVLLTHPVWLSVADTDAAGVTAARRRLLAELSKPDTIGFGGHFGDQPFGRVVAGVDGDYRWGPIPTAVLAPPPR